MDASHSSATRASAEHQRLRQDYRRLAAAAPLLAPHADTCFETLGKLGQGGMGLVLRVRDRRLDREAALKILTRGQSALARERFFREARVTARLAHPSIPPIYEVGETAEGQLFMIMKVIEGQTLASRIQEQRERPEPRRRRALLEALAKACEAVAYAHNEGVVHRDLKPANLMVGRFGEVMVMDWGIARDGQESAQADLDFTSRIEESPWAEAGPSEALTRSGSVVGTPGYMAPEQARGEAVDARADVFALGVILTEVLTGEPAIAGENPTVRYVSTIEGRIRRPRAIDSSVSEEWDYLVGRCLAYDREERWANGEELLAALRARLASSPIPGYRYSLRERVLRRARSHPGLLMSLSLGLLLIAALALFAVQRASLERARLQAELDAERTRRALSASRKQEEAAQNEARRAQRVLAEFSEARDLARRAAPAGALIAVLERALTADRRSAASLMTAAEICEAAGLKQRQESYLNEVADAHPPGYEALLYLHYLATGGDLDRDSEHKRRIIALAQERGEENEFTLVSRATSAFQERDYLACVALCREAEEMSEGLWHLYMVRGGALRELERYTEALADYNKAHSLKPAALAQTLSDRGSVYRAMGDPQRARDDYTAAIEADPETVGAYCNRANLSMAEGKWDEALEDYNKALENNPRDVLSLSNRGVLHGRMGHPELALADYNAAIAIASDYPGVYANRAAYFQERGELPRALRDYDRAIALRPKDAMGYCSRAGVRAGLGDWAGALEDADQAVALGPEFSPGYANRSLIRDHEGDRAGALADINRALELEPGYAAGFSNRGNLHVKMGNLGRALADYNNAIRLEPGLAAAYANRGRLFLLRGETERARRDFDKAIELDPKSAKNLVERANFSATNKDWARALPDLDRAIALEPKAWNHRFSRAQAYIKLRRYKEGLAELEASLALKPSKPEASHIRSEIQRLKGWLARRSSGP